MYFELFQFFFFRNDVTNSKESLRAMKKNCVNVNGPQLRIN